MLQASLDLYYIYALGNLWVKKTWTNAVVYHYCDLSRFFYSDVTIYSALFILKRDAVLWQVLLSFSYFFEPYYALYIQIKVAIFMLCLKNIFCKPKNMKPNAFVNFPPKSIPQYYSKSYKNWRLKLLQIFGFGPKLQIKQTNKQLWYLG